MLLQDCCQSNGGSRENETARVANVGPGRILTRKDAGVGGIGQRDLRHGLLKQHTTLRQRVKRWRFDVVVSVTMDMIRPQSIDRDQHHVERPKGDAHFVRRPTPRLARGENRQTQKAKPCTQKLNPPVSDPAVAGGGPKARPCAEGEHQQALHDSLWYHASAMMSREPESRTR